MGTRTNYGSGTFCWINLSSTDVAAARHFYAELLGWEYDERDGFSMARRYDANVAAIYEREEQERTQGLPPHWNNYVSVDDADAAAARSDELGGSVVEGPFDVTDAGRTAVIIDPTGAMFWVWQPRAHIGAGHVHDAGCLTWNELATRDPERAIQFYTSLFGWKFERADSGDGAWYWLIGSSTAANGRNGGMRELSAEEPQPHGSRMWMPFFTVTSAASATDTATALGGSVPYGPARVGAGTTAVVNDPTGAVFGVYEGEVDS